MDRLTKSSRACVLEMRLLKMGYFPLNGANHGLSLLLGGKFDIKFAP